MVSKLEVRFRSLLVNCEELSDDQSSYPRIRKFIRSLERMMEEMQESNESSSPGAITISDYVSRLNYLKTITKYTEIRNVHYSALELKNPSKNTELEKPTVKRCPEDSKLFSTLRKELINGMYPTECNIKCLKKGKKTCLFL